jgi:hypothetical protein
MQVVAAANAKHKGKRGRTAVATKKPKALRKKRAVGRAPPQRPPFPSDDDPNPR